MGTPFFKMTGSGNDFVFLDGRGTSLAEWPTDRIARACHRRFGIGADGLVLLEPAGPDAIRMHYFNADGGRAALCGNASLCSTRLADRLGMARPEGMTLHTDAGPLRTRCLGPGHMAEIRVPAFRASRQVALDPSLGEGGTAWFGDAIGVPHLIVEVEDLPAVDVQARGRALRYAPQFAPAGTNVNFVERVARHPEADWAIRTYERGVEGETLACSSGTISAGCALVADGRAELPLRFLTGSGRILSLAGQVAGGVAEDVWLCGEGRLVFTGEWEEE